MKRCPKCNRVETDNALVFCRVDGATLVSTSAELGGEAGTAKFDARSGSREIETSILPQLTNAGLSRGTGSTTLLATTAPVARDVLAKSKRRRTVLIVAVIVAAVAATASAFVVSSYLSRRPTKRSIESIAVLPFENKSGNADSDYLSDGVAESLIYKLSQLPNLRVSPRSSVFRYKGKEIDVEQVGAELGVDAVMWANDSAWR